MTDRRSSNRIGNHEFGSGSWKRQELVRWKKWLFRIAGLGLIPLVCVGLVEFGLKLGGFGYPTSFLIPFRAEGREWLAQNNQFGWRFFGRHMSRTPYPIAVPRKKAPGTIRIFVFGESAAYGDPQPAFGLPRMLEALLSIRHPGVHFEVVNVAMTGINSNVIRPIARDCVRADGDIWIVYMGNNEVIGPFGAGTVFGSRTFPLPLVHAKLNLLTTRTGQFCDAIARSLRPPPPSEEEWGGMRMFVEHPVRATDPQLPVVYGHYLRNLEDILGMGGQSGAQIVVSTVAVNLRDCAPFGSAHRPGWSKIEQANWEQLYQSGCVSFQKGEFLDAARSFDQAAQLDDGVAELHFRQGECALRLQKTSPAQRHFQLARDLDTLRFRCDTRLNELTKFAANNPQNPHIQFFDAARVMAENSPDGLPGQDLFYDHVHLTFEGTYLLAQTFAQHIEQLLPTPVRVPAESNQPWPTPAECAERLAWTDWSRHAVLREMLRRISDAPFTAQLNHDQQQKRILTLLPQDLPADNGTNLRVARAAVEKAILLAPGDPGLYDQKALLAQEAGDLLEAEAAARRNLTLLPSNGTGWAHLGRILAAQRRFPDAAAAFQRAVQLDAEDVWSQQNLAQALAKMGNRDAAAREFRRALAIKPRFGLAWLGLGQLLEEQGQMPAADDCYRRALVHRIRRPEELLILARFCQSHGWLEAATTNYNDAIQLNPTDLKPYLELTHVLSVLGRHADAAAEAAAAVDLAPNSVEGHYLYGVELGRIGHSKQAADQFRDALRLKPDLIEARINLGIALINEGSLDDARVEFESVLRRDPLNAVARRQMDRLRAKQ